jgi:HEAT repeat associated with sister chromatid cohesion
LRVLEVPKASFRKADLSGLGPSLSFVLLNCGLFVEDCTVSDEQLWQGAMKLLFVIALLLVFCSAAFSQQSGNRASVLADFKSPDVNRRADAYDMIKSDQEALRQPEVKKALMELLNRENQQWRTGPHPGEGYLEYAGQLVETVAEIADWRDPQQACVLVESDHSAGESQFSPVLVTKGGTTIVPCLLKLARGNANDRSDSIPILIQVLAVTKGLSDAQQQQIRQAIIAGLRDTEPGVRDATLIGAGHYGSPDLIPILQEMARSDPGFDSDGRGGKQYFVRIQATRAIQAIQQRAKTK